MGKVIFGGIIGFILATAFLVVTVKIYAAGQISIINSCDEDQYFVIGKTMYKCKKAGV